MTSKTISGTLNHGVTLTTTTYNYNPLYVTGVINAATGDGIYGDASQSWTIGNTGTITSGPTGSGIDFRGGGTVTNGAMGTTSARITGMDWGVFDAGTVTNFGIISGGSPTISGSTGGVSATTGMVTNFDTIFSPGSGDGVHLGSGNVTNDVGGLISSSGGGSGVWMSSALGGSHTVSNLGVIQGALRGVAIAGTNNPNVINGASGTISSSAAGTSINYGLSVKDVYWTLTNLGTIQATGSQNIGAVLSSSGISGPPTGGSVTNGHSGSSGGLISGSAGGILLNGFNVTLTNFGTIAATGGIGAVLQSDTLFGHAILVNSGTISGTSVAVSFQGSTNLLVLEHGYKLTGGVTANAAAANTRGCPALC